MLLVRRRVSLRRDRTGSPTLSLLTHKVRAARTRLSNALQFESHFRQLCKEHQHDGVPVQRDASQRLVERAAEDYVAAMDHLLEAVLEATDQPALTNQPERRLPLGL